MWGCLSIGEFLYHRISLPGTPTHFTLPMAQPDVSVVRSKPKQMCTEYTPMQAWRPGALWRVSDTSLLGAWGHRHLAKVPEHTCAIYGSKWSRVEHTWSADLLLVVGGFTWSKPNSQLEVWISRVVTIIAFSPRWLQDSGTGDHFPL